jgi:hypothetical protein
MVEMEKIGARREGEGEGEGGDGVEFGGKYQRLRFGKI